MQVKTKGVVLQYLKYKETSIILHMYTADYGYQSYIVNGVRSAKAKANKIGLFQPLTLLEVVAYHKEGKTLHRLSEAKISRPTPDISANFLKTSIGLFISEVVYNVLRGESEPDPATYVFLERAILFLNDTDNGLENFHLHFIANLSQYIGLSPLNYDEFCQVVHRHASYEEVVQLETYFSSITESVDCVIPGERRAKLLDLWLHYFEIKLSSFKYPRSLEVLREVFK